MAAQFCRSRMNRMLQGEKKKEGEKEQLGVVNILCKTPTEKALNLHDYNATIVVAKLHIYKN